MAQKLRIIGKPLQWYVENRTQLTKLIEEKSLQLEINYEVPQGSTLVPNSIFNVIQQSF